VAKDNTDNILVLLTWDFENDLEVSMYQIKSGQDEWPENYVVRGLNKKMNYFISRYRIYDLEFNVPF